MGKDHIQTRVPSELYQRIEKYEEERAYMNQAEAVRHLIRAGLDAETEEEPNELEKAVEEATTDAKGNRGMVEAVASQKTVLLATIMVAVGALAVITALAYPSMVLPAGMVAGALLTMSVTTATLAILAQLALSRPLRALVGFPTQAWE